ncbi:DUF6087 family protein [Streptomyces celluloflavus]|uniref:DUF6087 family protein n=1 Tax=Streptomyces celluloflavus TaxID=58344 RepID=UPI0036C38C10
MWRHDVGEEQEARPRCGPQRGEHVDPEQPRLIQRWNGSAWEVFTMAANLSEARELLRPADTESPAQEPAQPARSPLAPGPDRHSECRRTTPAQFHSHDGIQR